METGRKKAAGFLTGLMRLAGLILMLALINGTAHTQPSATQLADEIISQNNAHLSQIENITMTTDAMGFTSVTHYVKSMQDGIAVLEPADEDADTEIHRSMGKDLADAVRGANSISTENVDGFSTYRILIEDPRHLQEMMSGGPGFEEEVSEIKQVTLWLDSSELILRKAWFETVTNEGSAINMEMFARDYENHSGLPVAHTIEMKIEGLENEFSQADIEEARQGMAELERQLSGMPEAQRRMIEEQLRPQLEMFEAMLEGSGDGMGMTIQVTDVQVNRN